LKKENEETIAVKCDVKINDEPIKAVINSGVSVSIITNKLRNELEIPIKRKSKEVLVVANGDKVVVIRETELLNQEINLY
jgi:hypothetical protein